MKLFTMLFNAFIAMFLRNIAMFMASTSATAQSYNDTNVIGQVLQIGAMNNTGAFLAAIGGLNGARRIKSISYDMVASYSLNTGTQGNVSETATLSAGTAKFYAKTPVNNVTQINKYEIIVSDRREAATDEVASTTFLGNAPSVSEFDTQAARQMEQFNADWEFTCLQGTYTARSAVGVAEGSGGLVDSTIGITTNKVNASSASLDSDMIAELLVTMSENGAPMNNLAFVVRPAYLNQLNTLYGFAPQDRNVGGVQLRQIVSTFGPVSLIMTNNAPANTLLAVNMPFVQPVVLPHKGGIDILMKEFLDGSSAEKGYIEGYIGVDFKHESLHGKIYGLA
jgi:hypothetical protein